MQAKLTQSKDESLRVGQEAAHRGGPAAPSQQRTPSIQVAGMSGGMREDGSAGGDGHQSSRCTDEIAAMILAYRMRGYAEGTILREVMSGLESRHRQPHDLSGAVLC